MEPTQSTQTQPAQPISTSSKRLYTLVSVLIFLMIGLISWSVYQSYISQKRVEVLQRAYDTYATELAILKASSTASAESFSELYKTLSYVIEEEKLKNKTLEEKLGLVSHTVGSLDKLSKADPQLLRKYSKVSFLNENYIPTSLATIPTEFTYNKKNTYEVHADIMFFLQSMIDAAKKDNINLLVISAYRSFTKQIDVKALNIVKYGVGTANQFSAEQGFSEHQLGTTIDFTTATTGTNFVKFDTTKEYQWLKDNAHKYGFVLSYPKGNTYYAYEPWHWRFVGVELAIRLHNEGKYFYEYDQRTIDVFQTKIFDRY